MGGGHDSADRRGVAQSGGKVRNIIRCQLQKSRWVRGHGSTAWPWFALPQNVDPVRDLLRQRAAWALPLGGFAHPQTRRLEAGWTPRGRISPERARDRRRHIPGRFTASGGYFVSQRAGGRGQIRGFFNGPDAREPPIAVQCHHHEGFTHGSPEYPECGDADGFRPAPRTQASNVTTARTHDDKPARPPAPSMRAAARVDRARAVMLPRGLRGGRRKPPRSESYTCRRGRIARSRSMPPRNPYSAASRGRVARTRAKILATSMATRRNLRTSVRPS